MNEVKPFGMEEIYPNSYCESNTSMTDKPTENPLSKEIGGTHYKSAYQPIELMERVKMYACCSYIFKYMFRHKDKGKKQDLEKALHCCELMETLGNNWYAGNGNAISFDTSVVEFHRFIQSNKQLDANQIRAVIAICAKDIKSLKKSINMEIKEFYS